MAQLKDLLVTGDSRFLGNIYGNLKGTADKATADKNGNDIANIYSTKSETLKEATLGSDNTITFKTASGQTTHIALKEATFNANDSTKSVAGLMSATDKKKIDSTGKANGIATLDENGIVPVSQLPAFKGASSNAKGKEGLVPAPGSGVTGQYLKSNGTWATINYASSSSVGGTANSANKLVDSVDSGNATQPVYFKNGVPVATTYTLGKSVPSNAIFTDTTYSDFKGAENNTAGKSGLVPAPGSGVTGQYLKSDGTWATPYTVATKTKEGLMSTADKIKLDSTGQANGIATLNSSGKVPSSQLPSYVDDVIEGYLSNSKFYSIKNSDGTYDGEIVGESGKIYTDLNTNKIYRWSGTVFVVISETLALGTTSSTAYRGDLGAAAYNHALSKGSSFLSGFYKIATNEQGHVTAATAVTKKDITDLGIPGQDTNTTYNVFGAASASAAGSIGLVPAPAQGKHSQYLRGDGTWATPTNTTYSAATASAAGLMSIADKQKLDGIASGANKITVDSSLSSTSTNPVQNQAVKKALDGKASTATFGFSKAEAKGSDGLVPAPAAGAMNQYLSGGGWKSFVEASTASAGLMSIADKQKLDEVSNVGYYGSDEANSNGWYKVYSTTLTGWSDNSARLSICTGYNTINKGILHFHIRCDNTTSLTVKLLAWETRRGFFAGDAIIVTNGNVWTLYIKQTNSKYGRIKIRVLESMGTSSAWTMTLKNNSTKESTNPTATVTSVDGFIVNQANYATSADSANKLNTNAGSTSVPVYFSNGVPVACTEIGSTMLQENTTATSATNTITIPINIKNNISSGLLFQVYHNGVLLSNPVNYTIKSDNSAITLTYNCLKNDIFTFTVISKVIKTLDATQYLLKSDAVSTYLSLTTAQSNYALKKDYLPLSGGTMTGAINMGSKNITNCGSLSASTITTSSTIKATGAITSNSTITGTKVYGAVWNDYAEYRQTDTAEPGTVVCENGDDTMSISNRRMQPAAAIVSDTFGFAIGETDKAKTPIAVSGRVLAKPYEPIEEFRKAIGRPVCAGPNGTVSIMTDEEYATKGYCAIGTVSAIPDYEIWGDGVKVDNRIWIKVG